MESTTPKHTGCCDPFDPAPWQDREITWTNEPFVTDRVQSVFHMPLNMGSRVTRNMEKIEAAHAKASEQLMLCGDETPWGLTIYIRVARDVPDARMTTISGTFLTTVFEGPYRNVGRWMQEVRAAAAARGTPCTELFTSYTTCPRCAKAYGKNYVVFFARIA